MADVTSEQEVLKEAIAKGELHPELEREMFSLDAHKEIFTVMRELIARKRVPTSGVMLKKLKGDVASTYTALAMADFLPMDINIRINSLKEQRSKREIIKINNILTDYIGADDLHPQAIAEWLIDKAKEIAVLNSGAVTLSHHLKEWVACQTGTFTTQEACHSVPKRATPPASVRKVLQRFKKQGLIEPTGRKAGEYRIVSREEELIDWRSAESDEIPFFWPMGIGNHFRLMSKNIVTVAGESDAGKTALALALAGMNVNGKHGMPIHYFSSEMGPNELKSRLEQFELIQEEPLSLDVFDDVRFVDRVTNFQDVIRPNAVNIIDYLHMREEFYLIGKHLDEIYERLEGGVAIVLIQKKKGADYGYGAELTIQKARLSINLENGYPHHRAKLNKVKNWRNPQHNPNGLEIAYNLVRGCHFLTKGGWYRPEEQKEKVNEQSNYRRGSRSKPGTELHTERNSEGNSFGSYFGEVD
jgi:hypothetical protein